MAEYHEPETELSAHARDLHRACNSLKEEIEAVDWYHQRWETCRDESLRAILAHNRDEEIEHACMMLEWLRRNMPVWDEMLRTYLFTEAPITEIEEVTEGESARAPGEKPPTSSAGQPGDLGIGSLRGKK